MRILIHDYAGHPFPVSLARQLALRGHDVTHAFASQLLTPRGVLRRSEGDPDSLQFEAVPMSPAYRVNKYSFLKRLKYEREYGRELAKLVATRRPDLVLSGQTPSEPQLRMIRTAGRLGIPVVTWVQDFYSLAVDKLARKKIALLGALAGAWYRRLDAQCFARSAGIVAITEDFLPILAGFGVPAGKVSVIPNWAPLEELPQRPKQNDWTVLHGLADKFVFLYSGTLAMKHNPELLRQLAVRFRNDPAVRVIVISEGPGADYLRAKKVEGKLDNLEFLPFQPFEVLPDVLAGADVLVTVLEADAGVFSVPSKVLTYHAAGRAILGAMPEENLATRIVLEQQSGLCVAPADLDGFLAAAGLLRENTGRRKEMAVNARRYAEREFDVMRVADRFERVFSEAVKAYSGGPGGS
ncbi:MAG TPA: glycosyltransferase family 4 protein [Opitutaceae bacterium]